MRLATLAAGGLIGLLIGAPALAHPHIFIDTSLEVQIDPTGQATGLRISWTYDELTSLIFIEDRLLDPDLDGQLTEAEVASLSGFDMEWDASFAGDTYALLGAAPLALSGPSDWTVSYADGKVTSSHLRRFDAPVPLPKGAELVIQAYDPSYYTAYFVVAANITGATDCTAQLFEPDRAAADQILKDAIAEMAGTAPATDDAAEMGDFPAVGSAYAEEARVTCGAAS